MRRPYDPYSHIPAYPEKAAMKLSASSLSSDFGRLAEEVKTVE